MDSDISMLMDLVQTFGTWAIFLYLFVQERRAHDETRREYRDDLRNIAGMKALSLSGIAKRQNGEDP
jgi:hypothetical protein